MAKFQEIKNVAVFQECVIVFFFDCWCQSFETRTLQDPLKKLTARALMTLLACSPTAQNHAAKGNPQTSDGSSAVTCYVIFEHLKWVTSLLSCGLNSFFSVMVSVICQLWWISYYISSFNVKLTGLFSILNSVFFPPSWSNWQLCGANKANSLPAPPGVSPTRQGFSPQKGEQRLTGNFQSQCFCAALVFSIGYNNNLNSTWICFWINVLKVCCSSSSCCSGALKMQ